MNVTIWSYSKYDKQNRPTHYPTYADALRTIANLINLEGVDAVAERLNSGQLTVTTDGFPCINPLRDLYDFQTTAGIDPSPGLEAIL